MALLTTGLGFNYPGYTFVGFFTEPDGNGVQITDTTRYADLVANDTVTSISLYAYFVPDGAGGNGSGTSAETMSVVSEAVSLNAVATEPNTTLKPAKAARKHVGCSST